MFRSIKNSLKKNLDIKVVNMHTVKPIDKNQIKESIMQAKLIVTVEEHNIIGGLGSAVSEVMSKLIITQKKYL